MMLNSQDIDEEIAKILAMVFPECRIKHYLTNVTVFYEPNKYCTEVLLTVFYLPSGWYARVYDSDYMFINDIIARLHSVFEVDLVSGGSDTTTKAGTYLIRGTIDGRSYINKHD